MGSQKDADGRADGPSQGMRIAFLCFYPDWGHILPMLKIAKAAQSGGHTVRCYFPERCQHLAKAYGVPMFSVPQEVDADLGIIKILGSKSIFFLNFSGYGHTSLFIDPPVMRSALANVDGVIADARSFGPNIVVGDPHNLEAIYQFVARTCGAQYVRNDPSGTLARLYRRFVAIYGDVGATKLQMTVVEVVGRLFGRVYRPSFYLRHVPRWLNSRATKKKLRAKVAYYEALEEKKPAPIWSLTAGLTWVEERFVEGTPPWVAEPRSQNFPPLASAPEPIAAELEDWLAKSETPVVYISFGSVLGLKEETYRAIGQCLRQLPCRVVWSTPLGDTGALRDLAQDSRFYFTKYVPQAELLKRPELACFITHGGAGSVQEAMLGGTPMLCVPLSSDNGYISWLVERLGVAQRIWKRDLGKAPFADALRALLSNPAYRQRAAEIAAVLGQTAADRQVVSFLEQVGAGEPIESRALA